MSLLAPISDPGFEARYDHASCHACRALGLSLAERALFLAWLDTERPDVDGLAAAYDAYTLDTAGELL